MKEISLDNYPYLKDYEINNKGAGIKRVEEINALIEAFLNICPLLLKDKLVKKVDVRHLSPYIIADKYFENLVFVNKLDRENASETFSLINIYRVISGIELAIGEVQPILYVDFKLRSYLNANLGFFVGLGFLTGWEQADFLQFSFPNLSESEGTELSKLIQEHIDWLQVYKPNSISSYLPNAHFWWLLQLYVRELNEIRS